MTAGATRAALVMAAMLAATPAWAAPPLPLPSAQGPMLYLETTESAAFFMVLPAPERAGQVVDVWYFAALKTSRVVMGKTTTGSWIHGRMDCSARTFAMDDFIIIGTDHSTIWRDSTEEAPELAQPGSPNGIAMAMLCDGDPPQARSRTVSGVDEALRLTRSIAA